MMKEIYHIMINGDALILKSFCIINYENSSLNFPGPSVIQPGPSSVNWQTSCGRRRRADNKIENQWQEVSSQVGHHMIGEQLKYKLSKPISADKNINWF